MLLSCKDEQQQAPVRPSPELSWDQWCLFWWFPFIGKPQSADPSLLFIIYPTLILIDKNQNNEWKSSVRQKVFAHFLLNYLHKLHLIKSSSYWIFVFKVFEFNNQGEQLLSCCYLSQNQLNIIVCRVLW